MKKNATPSDFPFVADQGHIYNGLTESNFCVVNFGWAKFEFELHSGLVQDEQVCDGVTDFDNKKIKLEMALDDETARETILHEMNHVILSGIGLDEKNFDGCMISTTNEFLADSLAKQFMAIRNLNPGLMELIYEQAK